MLNNTTISVSELNQYVATLFQFDPILSKVSVEGEISNFVRHSSGHMYFSLKDEGAVVRCAMFRQEASGLAFLPANGMKVVAKGRISLYQKEGIYQFYVQQMRQAGVGDYYVAFEKLKRKLEEEGLFAPEHKRPLPTLPRRIGVITSPTGAVIRDIINVTARRFPGMNILLYPVTVQGETAAREAVRALEYFAKNKNVDVIILGRGGGSVEDLWAYNDEALARAVYRSEIPVISAVGHETDFTIVDFVADLRAPTPSAAAELAVPRKEELKEEILALQTQLQDLFYQDIDAGRMRLMQNRRALEYVSPRRKLEDCQMQLDRAYSALMREKGRTLEQAKRRLQGLERALDSLSPKAVLQRGYAIVEKESKAASARSLAAGDRVSIRFYDGTAQADITEVGGKEAAYAGKEAGKDV